MAALTTENHTLRGEMDERIHAAVAAAEEDVHARLAVEWVDRMQQEISTALAQAAAQHEMVLQECREEQEKRVEELTLSMHQQAVEQEVHPAYPYHWSTPIGLPLLVYPTHNHRYTSTTYTYMYMHLLRIHIPPVSIVCLLIMYPCIYHPFYPVFSMSPIDFLSLPLSIS